jgi:hypothetical protein
MIAPCACAGSIQYLHIECLHEWRRFSTNEEYKNRCMICRQLYNLPRRWPHERIDASGTVWDNFLDIPLFTAVVVHYVHMSLHGFMLPITTLEDGIIISFLYRTPLSKLLFVGVLLGMTGLYGLYFWPRLRRLQSPQIFWRAVAPDLFKLLCLQIFFLYLVSITIFPFGALYLVGLSYTREIYVRSLERMNREGQI